MYAVNAGWPIEMTRPRSRCISSSQRRDVRGVGPVTLRSGPAVALIAAIAGGMFLGELVAQDCVRRRWSGRFSCSRRSAEIAAVIRGVIVGKEIQAKFLQNCPAAPARLSDCRPCLSPR